MVPFLEAHGEQPGLAGALCTEEITKEKAFNFSCHQVSLESPAVLPGKRTHCRVSICHSNLLLYNFLVSFSIVEGPYAFCFHKASSSLDLLRS